MVSTRGIKGNNFLVGEKVLCYEPDMSKAKVLYDSKVLEVVEGKDKRGRRLLEYLVHFQGWSSSWDRKVTENFLLKDTDENRSLQKQLADKAQLQLNAYLYRREQKKRKRNLTEKVVEAINTSENNLDIISKTSEVELDQSIRCNAEEETIQLQIGDILKNYLDLDYECVFKEKKLHCLPAKVPVIAILENFVYCFSIKQILGVTQEQEKVAKQFSQSKFKKQKRSDNRQNKIILDIIAKIELCKEVADGIRLYFDSTLKDHLLYGSLEQKQYHQFFNSDTNLSDFHYVAPENFIQLNGNTFQEKSRANPIYETDNFDYLHLNRRLRSEDARNNDLVEVMSGMSSCSDSTHKASSFGSSDKNLKPTFRCQSIATTKSTSDILSDVLKWKLVQDYTIATPSMIYGVMHLTRLIVKLPEFLEKTPNISDKKLSTLLILMDNLCDFLETYEEFYQDVQYTKDLLVKRPINKETYSNLTFLNNKRCTS